MMVLLIIVGKEEIDSRDALDLTGNEFSRVGKKLPCNQKSELISSKVVPILVSKSAGLKVP